MICEVYLSKMRLVYVGCSLPSLSSSPTIIAENQWVSGLEAKDETNISILKGHSLGGEMTGMQSLQHCDRVLRGMWHFLASWSGSS